ncbi:TPA: hypothetical protein U1366_000057 [Streptococcus suis]|nr:hypothetical protein [Streptococcus suis]
MLKIRQRSNYYKILSDVHWVDKKLLPRFSSSSDPVIVLNNLNVQSKILRLVDKYTCTDFKNYIDRLKFELKSFSNLTQIFWFRVFKGIETKETLKNIQDKRTIMVIVPFANELNIYKRSTLNNPKGQDCVRSKLQIIEWLNKINCNLKFEIMFIDDSKEQKNFIEIRKIIKNKAQLISFHEYYSNNLCFFQNIKSNFLTSRKGKSVHLGLKIAHMEKYNYAIYIDFDGTYGLEQIGLGLNKVYKNEAQLISFSRRLKDSEGYYQGAVPETVLSYSNNLNALLKSQSTFSDFHSGFKIVDLEFYSNNCSNVQNFDLEFDYDIFSTILKAKGRILEVPVVAMHEFIEGKQGVSRSYVEMYQKCKSFEESFYMLE